MTTRLVKLVLASALIALVFVNPCHAQRRGGGGGGGGGQRGGGGGMVGNRGNVGRPNPGPQTFNNISRPNANVPNFNRPNLNVPNGNREPLNVPNFNRQNINVPNVNNRQNIFNNTLTIQNRPNVNIGGINNLGAANFNRGYGGGFGGVGGYGGGYRPGYSNWGGYGGYHGNPYYAYHQNWVHGSWNGNYGPGWGGYNVGNSALGLGAAVGIGAWGLSSLANSWGYSRYSNPYYGSAPVYSQQPGLASSFDYSRPLDFASSPPAQAITQTALASFDTARQAFQAGDYNQALSQADQALRQTPNDPILHEFRAICLFALRRFDEAAAPFYTVLSAGPGFDWTTLIGLYPDVATYTGQLRALEAYCNASPRAASARFVLASLYLTQGSTAAAAVRLREVVAIQPQDRLSSQLLTAIETPSQATPGDQPPAVPTPPAQPEGAPGQDQPPLPSTPVPADFLGVWTARPVADVTITLTLGPARAFAWKVVEKGQTREFSGEAGLENDVLAMVPLDMPPMVGKVSGRDAARFHFKALGTPADDPGLDFVR